MQVCRCTLRKPAHTNELHRLQPLNWLQCTKPSCTDRLSDRLAELCNVTQSKWKSKANFSDFVSPLYQSKAKDPSITINPGCNVSVIAVVTKPDIMGSIEEEQEETFHAGVQCD